LEIELELGNAFGIAVQLEQRDAQVVMNDRMTSLQSQAHAKDRFGEL
jgi:hypothetical protein